MSRMMYLNAPCRAATTHRTTKDLTVLLTADATPFGFVLSLMKSEKPFPTLLFRQHRQKGHRLGTRLRKVYISLTLHNLHARFALQTPVHPNRITCLGMGITRVKSNAGAWCLPHPALYLESRSCGPGRPAGPCLASLTEPMADALTTIGILAAQPMHRSQKQGCGVANSPNTPAFASHVTCSSPLCTASAHLSSYGGLHFVVPGFGHICQGRNISFSLDRGKKKIPRDPDKY
ncbi:hypothetical protein LX32DRAFT_463634 [Colletotrichum zoysiae]|uniref:Uncharacterized protein n=1 Tax=Colletotrichum zoysiae TaxID=1216348 RepID=A0AAD9LYB7_9PEZI|nr:hypothetical protein LX32DRAFT_463634 [Colletotrichum zoysiae]